MYPYPNQRNQLVLSKPTPSASEAKSTSTNSTHKASGRTLAPDGQLRSPIKEGSTITASFPLRTSS